MTKAIFLLVSACAMQEEHAHAIIYDGVDDHVVITDAGELVGAGITLEASVRPGVGGQALQNLVAKRSPGGREDAFTFRLRQDRGGVLELGLGSKGREWGTAGKIAVPRGVWTAVAVTHNRETGLICFYVAGELDVCATSPIPPGSAPDQVLWLGGDPLHGPTARPFRGRLDDVRIWSVVRTAAQVRGDASAPAPAGSPGLAWASE